MARSIIALDMRTDSISAVAVSLGFRVNRVTACAHVPIDPRGDIEQEWETALQRLSGQMNLAATVCTVSFPASRLLYRNAHVPFTEKKKIRQVLPFNLEPYMPVQVEDLLIEFQPVGFNNRNGGTDLVTAAIRKSDLDRCLKVLNAFQLKPSTVTVGGYAAARVLASRQAVPNQSVVMDVEAATCSLFLLNAGQVGYARSFTVNPDATDRPAAVGIQIQRSMLAFEEIFDINFQPDGIYLTGVGAGAHGFPEKLSERLKIPVQCADFSMRAGKTPASLEDEAWRSVSASNALPLVLSETASTSDINFTREVFAGEKFWRTHKTKLMKTGLLALLVAGIAMLNFVLDVRSKQKMLEQLDTRMEELFRSAFPDVNRIVDPLHQMRLRVKAARSEAEAYGLSRDRVRAIDILNDISRNIPDTMDVQLERLSIGPDGILISGNSDTFNTVDDMKNRLENAPSFKTIAISSTSKDKSGKRINFKLKIQI